MSNYGVRSLNDLRKKFTSTYELISVAHHEAAHAVYGLIKGFKIDSVSVFENKKRKRIEGVTHYTSPQLPLLKDPVVIHYSLEAEVCFRYAGLTGERYHFKQISGSDQFPSFLKDGCSDDTLTAASFIRKYSNVPPGKKRYLYKKRLITKTWRTLGEYWDDVTIVAHALIKDKSLSFIELQEVIIQNTKNHAFWQRQLFIINNLYHASTDIDETFLKFSLEL